MAQIIKVNEIPMEYKKEPLDFGVYGKCFLTSDGRVLKEFKTEIKQYEYSIKRLSELKSKNIVFPSILFYDNSGLIGYISEYVVGQRFDALSDSINLDGFINAILDLENELNRLSSDKVVLYDCNSRNIFYVNNKEIKIIDIDLFSICDAFDKEQVYRLNLCELYEIIASFIIKNDIAMIDSRLIRLNNMASKGNMRISNFLYEIKREIERVLGYNIRTYGEFNNNLKLVMYK